MSRLYQVQRSNSILIEFNASTGGAVVPIATFGGGADALALKADPNFKGMIGLLNNLRAIATITSLPEIALPNFENLDSDTERMIKVLDVQWKSPRKQLAIMQSADGGTTWIKTAALSLLNSGGYPYTNHNLLNFLTDDVAREFPDGHRIGLRLEDVGTGLLGAGDSVIIDGSYVEEFSFMEPTSSIGTVITPDLNEIESELLIIKNAIASVATEVGIIKSDLADDPEMADLNALNSKLDQILLELPASSGGNMRSGSSTELAVTVGTTSAQLITADATGLRISLLITNNSTTATVYIRTGADVASSSLYTFKLSPGYWVEIATGEVVQAIASESASVTVAEFLS